MKFNAIVGNPPYQKEDGGFRNSAHPIYDFFTKFNLQLKTSLYSLIIPARWFAGGKGIGEFREFMLKNDSIRELHDFPVAIDCFEDVQIKGGVCIFLMDASYKGKCLVTTHIGNYLGKPQKRLLNSSKTDVFIRYNEALSILQKVRKFKEKTMDSLVSRRIPFGLPTYFHGEKEKTSLSKICLYENRGVTYTDRSVVRKREDDIDKHKVYIPRSSDGSDFIPHVVLGIPFYGEPGSVCSETFNMIGPFDNEETCQNVMQYVSTKFFRFLALQRKVTQSATKDLYKFIPVQDFSKSWTDEEIHFVERTVRPMDLNRQRKQRYWKDLHGEFIPKRK